MPIRFRSLFAATAVCAALVTAGSAHAKEGPRLELGARTGYGVPAQGSSAGVGDTLDSEIAGQIPLWVDLGVRIRPEFFVGAYFDYGVGIPGELLSLYCDQVTNGFHEDGCSSRDIRLGGEMAFHFLPKASLDPWVGAGFGLEWEGWDIDAHVPTGGKRSISVTGNGLEHLNLHFGLDYGLSHHFSIGPFVTMALSEFRSRSVSCRGACKDVTLPDTAITDKTLHEWLFVGIRAVFLP
jgi:hypothetical protein